MLSAKQIPKDGYGKEKTLYGRGIRLKARDLTKTASTTLKITGMTSGAVWYIDLVVRNGQPARFSPPSMTPPGGPPPDGRKQEKGERKQEKGERKQEKDERETEKK